MNYLRNFNKLLIYRNLITDELLVKMNETESAFDECEIALSLMEKAEEVGLEGDLAKEYIYYLLSHGENLLSKVAEQTGGMVGDSLLRAAAHDIEIISNVLSGEMKIFKEQSIVNDYYPTTANRSRSLNDIKKIFIKNNNSIESAKILSKHYGKYGYGLLADYMAFKWDAQKSKLIGVNSCDDITFDDIIGYTRQKDELMANTEAFLQGLPANNVLLYGERGTGKSSSIKALVNKYFADGLRLVEVSRMQFAYLPTIMGSLSQWGKKFILYLDDLSFEEFEVEYKQLKSTIDGGIETKPDNVLIYATSNRRNIIKEVWADNEGDELHRSDTINEKVSLSDRFGLKVFFISPDQEAYLNIIYEKATKRGLNMTREELKKEAIKWEMSHTGRSGRIAEQLITYLLGFKERKKS